jgi:outer membrane protein
MNQKHLIIESVLAVAIIVLFVLHFTSGKHATTFTAAVSGEGKAPASGNIVYVNIDTLLNNYDSYHDMRAQLAQKQKNMEAEFTNKGNSYQKAVADYQEKAQKGLITRSEAQKMEQQLMGEQQNLVRLRDNYSQQLSEEEQVLNRKLINDIVVYLKDYNKDGRYTYIMSNTFGGNLLYVPDSLNITKDVLKGINEQYAKNKKDKK